MQFLCKFLRLFLLVSRDDDTSEAFPADIHTVKLISRDDVVLLATLRFAISAHPSYRESRYAIQKLCEAVYRILLLPGISSDHSLCDGTSS